jgi:hypothetical protein
MFDKAKSSVIAKPMIPLIYKRLVHLVEKRQPSVVSAPDIHFGYGVTTSGYPQGHSVNSIIV